MKKHKVEIPIYFGDLIIVRTSDFAPIIKLHALEPDTKKDDAFTFRDERNEGYTKYVVVFGENPDHDTIAHEALHIVNMVFHDRGVKADCSNDENQCLFLGWVVAQIYKAFKNSFQNICTALHFFLKFAPHGDKG